MPAPSTTLLGAGAGLAAALSWGLASLLFARALRRAPAARDAGGEGAGGPAEGTAAAGPPSAAAANLFKNALGLAVFGALLALAPPAAPSPTAWTLLLLSGVTGFALGDALYLAAVARLGVQPAAVLGLLNVPVAAVLAALFLAERLTPATIGWMALALGGVLLVIVRRRAGGARGPGAAAAASDTRARRTGLACALLAPVCWGSSIVLGHGGMTELGVLTGTVLRLAGGVAAALVLAAALGLATRRGARAELARVVAPFARLRTARALLPASIAGALVCLGFFHYALRELPGGVSPVLYSTTPLFTLPLGLFFGERHGRQVVLGTLVGFAGVVGVVRSLPPEPSTGPAPSAAEAGLSPARVAPPAALTEGAAPRAVAVAPAGRAAALAWIAADAGGATLALALLGEAGWSAAERVAHGDARAVDARGPLAVASVAGHLAVAWTRRPAGGDGEESELAVALRPAQGGAWSVPRAVPLDARGGLELVALDGRTLLALAADGRGALRAGVLALEGPALGTGPLALAEAPVVGELLADDLAPAAPGTPASFAATLLAGGRAGIAYRARSGAVSVVAQRERGRRGAASGWSRAVVVPAAPSARAVAGEPAHGAPLALALAADVGAGRVALVWSGIGATGPSVSAALADADTLAFGPTRRVDDVAPPGAAAESAVAACLMGEELCVTWASEGAGWRLRRGARPSLRVAARTGRPASARLVPHGGPSVLHVGAFGLSLSEPRDSRTTVFGALLVLRAGEALELRRVESLPH